MPCYFKGPCKIICDLDSRLHKPGEEGAVKDKTGTDKYVQSDCKWYGPCVCVTHCCGREGHRNDDGTCILCGDDHESDGDDREIDGGDREIDGGDHESDSDDNTEKTKLLGSSKRKSG